MSEFEFNPEDFSSTDSFLLAAAQNQTNVDHKGTEVPLRTTMSQSPPRETITIFSISDAAMNTALMKPVDAASDIYNRIGQDVIAHGIAENGGVQTVLGPYANLAPNDMLIKIDNLPTSVPDYASGGSLGAASPTVGGGGSAGGATQDGNVSVEDFVKKCLDQTGDRYVWGAGRNNQADPDSFDCSGLVYWACLQVGISGPPATAYYQWKWAKPIPLDQAKNTRGALVFTGDGTGSERGAITHVGISLGNDTTIEARGKKYGVGSWPIGSRYNYGGLIPGIRYGTTSASGAHPGGVRNYS